MRRVLGKILKAGLEPVIETVRHFDDEADAFNLEIELITKYGRRNLRTGSLCNLTDGGEGVAGVVAKAHAERARERLSKLKADPEYAKAHSERMRKMHADPNFKKSLSERGRETLRKLKADPEFQKAINVGLRKKFSDPEYAKAHAARAGETFRKLNADPVFAKASAERSRQRMRERLADPEFLAKALAGRRALAERRRAAREQSP